MARIDFAELKDIEHVRKHFWTKVQMGLPHECWPWTDALDEKGYGVYSPRFRIGRPKRAVKASRMSVFLSHGELDPELDVLHKCDNPACVNPLHLKVGTPQENMTDKVRKGRWKGGSPPGSKAGNAKLTEEQVIEIRALKEAGTRNVDLAKQFAISPSVISLIVNRVRWTHI